MNEKLKDIIESLIFVSLEPLSLEKIKGVLKEFRDADVQRAIQELLDFYTANEKGIQIIQAAGGFLFATKPEHEPWIKRLLKEERKYKLSHAALETLAIIAYHQPVTLAEISAIRGVDTSHSLKTLLQKKLVKITGRKKGPGRPLIYRTSDKFLLHFGLDSLKDLPSEDEIAKLLEEDRSGE